MPELLQNFECRIPFPWLPTSGGKHFPLPRSVLVFRTGNPTGENSPLSSNGRRQEVFQCVARFPVSAENCFRLRRNAVGPHKSRPTETGLWPEYVPVCFELIP